MNARTLIAVGCAVALLPAPVVARQLERRVRLASTEDRGLEARERLIVRAQDGTVVATAEGDAHHVTIEPALDRLLRTRGGHLTMTHNHPASASLSGDDLGQLAKAGVEIIEAIGEDGSEYRAAAGPLYDADRFQDVAYAAAAREMEHQLRCELRQTPRPDVDAHFSHLIAIALDKAHVIHYRAALSAARTATFERNRVAFGRATEAAAAAIGRALKQRARSLT